MMMSGNSRMILRFDSNHSSRIEVVVHVLDAEIPGNPGAVDDERHRHLVQLLEPGRAFEGVPLFGSHRSSSPRRVVGMTGGWITAPRQHYSLRPRCESGGLREIGNDDTGEFTGTSAPYPGDGGLPRREVGQRCASRLCRIPCCRRIEDACRNPRPHRRSVRLGAVARQRPTAMARLDATRVERADRAVLRRRSESSTSGWATRSRSPVPRRTCSRDRLPMR